MSTVPQEVDLRKSSADLHLANDMQSSVPPWEAAAEYLVAAGAIPSIPASPLSFASEMRDGSVLCRLVSTLSNHSISYNLSPTHEVSISANLRG